MSYNINLEGHIQIDVRICHIFKLNGNIYILYYYVIIFIINDVIKCVEYFTLIDRDKNFYGVIMFSND